ncbi:MAG: precorrin-2 C(20)-methyltransferase, partial [Ornithinimicrobium sp.]
MTGADTHAQPGHLYGVGVGPGDPRLMTVMAADLIGSADVVAFHAGTGKQSIAHRIASDLIPEQAVIEELRYPVTTGGHQHPGGYYAALEGFYDECVARLAAHLAQGRSVVVLAVGDPLFYGSFMYVHDTLSQTYPSHIVPGVTSISAASAAMGTGLCRHEDTLTVLPGTLPVPELARRLADTDAAVIMKLGKTFAGVREAIRQAGLTERAWYVERASTPAEKAMPLAEVSADAVPYMSIILIPGVDRRDDRSGRASASASSAPDDAAMTTGPGTVYVVGLGPGPDKWLSPEASEVLARVDHVVGYAP